MENKDSAKFENTLLVVIIIMSFTFLAYAYYVTTDPTMRGVILGGIIAVMNTCINWRFGSSKSSANKDDTIKSLQADVSKTTVKADTVNADTVETVNTNTTNVI